MAEKKFLMGNEVLGMAARAAGARAMFGYPITPSTEIMHYWAKEAVSEQGKKDGLVFCQAEDEIASGFMLIGSVLRGTRAFTATAGPGHVLMQDAVAMAEALRLPVVLYIMQRGGPSTSTVIYSQSEVNLACFGGNGNGYRVVYSPATVQELYDYGIKAFDTAWRHRFPTVLLGDGYLGKMMDEVETYAPSERRVEVAATEPYILERERVRPLAEVVPSPELEIRVEDGVEYACLRNCLNLEEETLAVNEEIKAAFDKAAPSIVEFEEYGDPSAPALIVAHGIVSGAVKAAVDSLSGAGVQARLFRPITLRPFPDEALRRAAAGAKRVLVAESADGQLARSVAHALCGHVAAPIREFSRPSMGILPEDIEAFVTAE